MFRKERTMILAVIALPFAPNALAANSSVGANWTSLPNTNTERFELNATTNSIGENLALRFGIGMKQYDLDEIMIRDIDGSESPLSKREKQNRAVFGSLQAQKNWGVWGAAISWDGTIGSDPFASQRLRLSGDWRSYETASTLGVTYALGEQTLPENSYLDRDFVSKRRPQEITQLSVGVFGEQLLLEATKIRLQAGMGFETAERPQNRSWEARVAQGFLDGKISIHLFAGNLEEQREKSLKNERGYFSIRHAGGSILAEPILDQIVELTVQEQTEREFDPRVDEQRETDSRTYGVGLNLKNGPLVIKPGVNYSITDQEETFWGIKGDVQWELE